MVPGSAGFAELIRAQASDIGKMGTPSLELVAASVQRVAGFANAGQGASGHGVTVDEPEQFGGTGTAADPAELLLIAIGASLSVTLTVHATLAEMDLAGVQIALSGKLDPGRFFTPDAAAGGGFFDIEISVAIDSTAPPSAVRALVDSALLASPVLRSVVCTPNVTLSVNGATA